MRCSAGCVSLSSTNHDRYRYAMRGKDDVCGWEASWKNDFSGVSRRGRRRSRLDCCVPCHFGMRFWVGAYVCGALYITLPFLVGGSAIQYEQFTAFPFNGASKYDTSRNILHVDEEEGVSITFDLKDLCSIVHSSSIEDVALTVRLHSWNGVADSKVYIYVHVLDVRGSQRGDVPTEFILHAADFLNGHFTMRFTNETNDHLRQLDVKNMYEKSRECHMRIKVTMVPMNSTVSFFQIQASPPQGSKVMDSVDTKIVAKYTDEVWHSSVPRVVPNNRSTNLNVRGHFDVGQKYACGISEGREGDVNQSVGPWMVPHNSSLLVCEIPPIRTAFKKCETAGRRGSHRENDNWKRCYSEYKIALFKTNVFVNTTDAKQGPFKESTVTGEAYERVEITFAGKREDDYLIITDFYDMRSDLEWNSQVERQINLKDKYYEWNGFPKEFFGKRYNPNDF